MPIDPQIALSAQGIPPAINPLQLQNQIQQGQLARAGMQSMLAERQAQTQDIQAKAAAAQLAARQNAALDEIYKNAYTTDPDTGAALIDPNKIQQGVINANMGHLWPQMSDAISKMNDAAINTNKARRQQLAENLWGLSQAPDAVKPQSAMTVIAGLRANQLMTPDHVQAAMQELGQNPTAADVDRVVQKYGGALPEFQALANKRAADVASLQKTQAETAAQQADAALKGTQAGQITRQQEISNLAAAPSAQAYAAVYAKLPPASQQNYPPPQAWTPKTPQALMMMGLTPEQASQRQLGWANLAETAKKNAAELAMMDPSSPKNQERMEQQGAQLIKSELLPSSRTGLGVENNKVNTSTHLLTMFDKYRDAQGNYNIPPSQYAELATGLANLVSGSNSATDAQRKEIETRTAKGDLNGLLTYVTGTPYSGSTQDVFQNLRDSIVRQGAQAQQNRGTIMRDINGLLPSDLAPDRRQRLIGSSIPVMMPANTVKMRAPDGSIQDVPESKVRAYVSQGATVVTGG